MQFHQYVPVKTRYIRGQKDREFERRLKGIKANEFREKMFDKCSHDLVNRSRHTDTARLWCQRADMEEEWIVALRPYYNFWPVSLSLAKSVRLVLPMKLIKLPSTAILLRFPHGHEPYSVGTAMLLCDTEHNVLSVHGHIARSDLEFSFWGPYDAEETFEEFIERKLSAKLNSDQWDDRAVSGFDFAEACGLMMRLAVFVSLLSHGEDLVTPIVLAKDQTKYDQTRDEGVKKWLEDRAARRMGKGFNVGQKLQVAKDQSPHWRNPHLALFWTGEGRTVPVIKFRSGSIVQRVSIAEVPTGYFGPETEKDDEIFPEATPRDGISKSRRYDLMKRDGFRCQLCGTTQESGGVLHLDHRIALANGGSNMDENLWTLCETCNLGKSAKSL